jgi:hypothetical protein
MYSISWEYNKVAKIPLKDYEETRPPRRSHFEMVLPRKVRQDMLKRDWDVKQSDIASAVRMNIKIKNQRKATVNNLGKATKMELLFESAGRKLKRMMTLKKTTTEQVKDLEESMNAAQRRRSQIKLQVQMKGEYDEPAGEDILPEMADLSGTTEGTGPDAEQALGLDISTNTI